MVNLLKFQRAYAKKISAVIFPALTVFIFVINNCAQVIRIEEDINDLGYICGLIEDGRLTVPSYKFRVTDKDGNVLRNLRTEGRLVIEEGVWVKNGFLGIDSDWKIVDRSIKIPVTFDFKEDAYVTSAIPKVSVAGRKKGAVRNKKCLNKVTKLYFSFYQNDCDSTSFIFFFPYKTIDKINLPSAENIYNLGVITGYSCVDGIPRD